MKRTFILGPYGRRSAAVLNVSDSEKLGRRKPSEVVALAGEVRLVGVAGLRRSLGYRHVPILHQGQEVPEAEHAAEGLGPVANGFVEPAPQLPLTDVELPAQVAHSCC